MLSNIWVMFVRQASPTLALLSQHTIPVFPPHCREAWKYPKVREKLKVWSEKGLSWSSWWGWMLYTGLRSPSILWLLTCLLGSSSPWVLYSKSSAFSLSLHFSGCLLPPTLAPTSITKKIRRRSPNIFSWDQSCHWSIVMILRLSEKGKN